MRHIYRVYLESNGYLQIEGKKELLNTLKKVEKEITKIDWYVSNGNWSDVTKKYIK